MKATRTTIPNRMPTPVVGGTLVVLLAIWILSAILARTASGSSFFALLALDPGQVLDEGRVWTLVSYALLHGLDGPFHLLMNGLLIYFFGPELERRTGGLRFAFVLVVLALGGGLAVFVASLLGLTNHVVVGASGVALGLLTIWGLTNRDRPILLFFVLPVRGIHMVWFSAALAVMEALSLGPVSASAHIGGMLTGGVVFLLLKRQARTKLWVDDVLVALRLRKKPKLTVVPKSGPWVH